MPDATAADLDHALGAAARGFDTWRHVQPWARATMLRRIGELIRERMESLALLMSAESGKPLAEARGEWNASAEQFEWYSEETKRIYGQLVQARDADVRVSVIYQPIGSSRPSPRGIFRRSSPPARSPRRSAQGARSSSNRPASRQGAAWRSCKPVTTLGCRPESSTS